MPINGLVISKDATSAAATGGTATTFTQDGVEIKNGVRVADAAEASFILRSNIVFRNRNPVLKSDGSWTKGKRSITLTMPKTLADLSTVFNIARIDFEMHPEMTTAEVLNLRLCAAQCIFDADVDAFINTGSVA